MSTTQGVIPTEGQVVVLLPGDKIVVVQSTPIVTVQPVVPQVAVPVVTPTQTPVVQPAQSFSLKDIRSYWSDWKLTWKEGWQSVFGEKQPRYYWQQFRNQWRTLDTDLAFEFTQFKREYVFPLGDIPVRTICMAVSTGLTYSIFGRRNPSFVGRTRNLAINFVINGLFWVPEMFNPLLTCRPTV